MNRAMKHALLDNNLELGMKIKEEREKWTRIMYATWTLGNAMLSLYGEQKPDESNPWHEEAMSAARGGDDWLRNYKSVHVSSMATHWSSSGASPAMKQSKSCSTAKSNSTIPKRGIKGGKSKRSEHTKRKTRSSKKRKKGSKTRKA